MTEYHDHTHEQVANVMVVSWGADQIQYVPTLIYVDATTEYLFGFCVDVLNVIALRVRDRIYKMYKSEGPNLGT